MSLAVRTGKGQRRTRAPWTVRFRWLIVAMWLAVAAVALPFALRVNHNLSTGGFEAPGSAAVWADHEVQHLTSAPVAEPVLVTGLPTGEVRRAVLAVGLPPDRLRSLGAEASVYVPPQGLPAGKEVPLRRELEAKGGHLENVDTTTISHELSRDSETTLHTSTAIALPILAILLLLVFGTVAAAVLPLVVAMVGSELTLAVVDLLEDHLTLSIYLTDIVTFLALGVGVDYALFIATRFRQALRDGLDVPAAVGLAMRTSGRSVFFSGLAVALAMATLFLGRTAYFNGLALGGAVSVASVLLATHTLLPALLSFFGRGIEWGRLPSRGQGSAFWRRLAAFGVRQAHFAIPVGLVLLLVPGVFGPRLTMTVPANLATMLPRDSLLRRASRVVQALDGAGSVAPFPVVMRLPTTVSDPGSWAVVARVAERAGRLPGAASVSAPVVPGLTPAMMALAYRTNAPPALAASRQALGAFVNPRHDPHLFAIYVTSRADPDAAATIRLFDHLRTDLPALIPKGGRLAVGGAVGILAGFNRFTAHQLPWVIGAVAAVAFLVLFLATGSLLQAFLGVLMDALVALATAGLLVLVVQHGALGFEPLPPNTAVTPLIFVLLFGLSMDYEVILLHRIQEILREGRSVREAAEEGIAATGAMITGAGLIMVVVFVVLLGSPLQVLRTLGVGMTAAILLDTWVVRTFLVPGAVALMGRHAFWPVRLPAGREAGR